MGGGGWWGLSYPSQHCNTSQKEHDSHCTVSHVQLDKIMTQIISEAVWENPSHVAVTELEKPKSKTKCIDFIYFLFVA